MDNNANILVYKPNIKIRAHNTLGKSAHAGTSFKGTLGSLHIWNRVLTADEVRTLYNDGKITPSFMTLEECASRCETNHDCNSFAYGNPGQINTNNNGIEGACIHYRNEYNCTRNPKWSYYQVKGASPYIENTEDNDIVSRITELENNVGNNTGNDITTKISALETTVGNNNSGLVSDINALETTVGNNHSDLVSDINALETTVGNNNSGLVSDINALETSLNAISVNTNSNTDAISDISTNRLQTLFNKFLISDTSINTLETTVDDVGNQISVLSGDVDISMLNTVSTFAQGQNIDTLQNITTILGDLSSNTYNNTVTIGDLSSNTYNNTVTIGDLSSNTYNNTVTIDDINNQVTDISNTILNDVIHRWMNQSDISGDPIQTAFTPNIDVSGIVYSIYNDNNRSDYRIGKIGKYF